MLWYLKNLVMLRFWSKNKNLNFLWPILWKTAIFWVRYDLRSGLVCSFSKPSHFTVLTKRTNKSIFCKIGCKNSNSYFFVKVLTCPTILDVRPSTEVKRGWKVQLEPDQNPMGRFPKLLLFFYSIAKFSEY